jgi:uncharacterized protein (TIGR02757 family)
MLRQCAGVDFESLRETLDATYARYHQRRFIHPDPLEFLYHYDDPLDREVVGMVASALAYGRVAQILQSVSTVLARMGSSPSDFALGQSLPALRQHFAAFKHRFTEGREMAALLYGVAGLLRRHGSLHHCFASHCRPDDQDIVPGLTAFADELLSEAGGGLSMLLPDPRKGSACKRLNLFLRWMVRRDEIDPGGWDLIRPALLIVPLDTHMYGFARNAGLTRRKQADLAAAVETTRAFRLIDPTDPVRYDFALTRRGIRDNMARQKAFRASP